MGDVDTEQDFLLQTPWERQGARNVESGGGTRLREGGEVEIEPV